MTPKNPPDFPKRLKLLMEGEGWSTRALAEQTGDRVSHSTINSWMNDASRAATEQIAVVAEIFGWTVEELYYGRGGTDTLNRLAEVDGALRQSRRAATLLAHAVGLTTGDAAVAGAKPHPSRRAVSGE